MEKSVQKVGMEQLQEAVMGREPVQKRCRIVRCRKW